MSGSTGAEANIYDRDLAKNAANHAALTPLTFIAWTAEVYPERLGVVHGSRRFTWREVYARARRLGSALAQRGIGAGNTVSAMLSNTPEMCEAHFGVPMCGATLHALNTRLDADAIAFMLRHAETQVLLTDREFAPTITAALAQLEHKPLVIDVLDPEYGGPGERVGTLEYEALLASGDPEFAWQPPGDEWDAIALNYTSGTTGNPKGVVYHHRGAYLNALGNILAWGMRTHPVYLWTLPMFHCNGWCFPWTVTALAGTHVCLRRVEAPAVYDAIDRHGVTHLCGAPVVMNML
ncbi:MAG TPA: AMP-binding protein, partial [Polyangiales bacterium]|nr:AMP-binding protein [Polyangiales bacterium]